MLPDCLVGIHIYRLGGFGIILPIEGEGHAIGSGGISHGDIVRTDFKLAEGNIGSLPTLVGRVAVYLLGYYAGYYA